MKLLNQSLKYVSVSILLIVTAWSVVFYLIMIGEIKDTIDEGLENYKAIIIQNAARDSSILNQKHFDEDFFSLRKIGKKEALSIKDRYIDTEIYMQDADDPESEPEPVRMLTTAFEIDGRYYELKVANSMVEEDDLIDALFWNVLWLYIVLIASIIIVNNSVLKKLWKPFYALLGQLKTYRLGSSQNFPEVNTDTKEFIDLQKAVNTLLQHSVAAYERQKEFIGNASHELQTPLAIVTNKIELLLENDDLKNDSAEKVAEVYQIIERLVRLNKSLLLLSKIDNKQFFDNQPVSINKIVDKTLGDLEEIVEFRQLKVTYIPARELEAQMDVTLANIVVANLLKNAVTHNNERGKLEVKIGAETLKISNTGKLENLDSERIFQRFQKQSAEGQGTGLGLAIVKAIVDLYGFSISYAYLEGIHNFEVRFTTH